MNKTTLIAALSPLLLCPILFAQSLLDQQLGPAPATPAAKPGDATDKPPAPAAGPGSAAPTPQPEVQPGPTPNAANDIISPEAVKRVDDADLVNQLTKPPGGNAPGGANPVKQQMADMLDRMDQSQKLLTNRDPGAVTQETQRRILTDLDVLIEYARQQQQQSGSSQKKDQDPQTGQQRSYSQGNQPGEHNEGGTNAATSSMLPGGGADTPQPNTNIHNRGPGEWGNLAARDRDLIAHGANEQYLSSYRDLIDRYYQALAELGKSKNH